MAYRTDGQLVDQCAITLERRRFGQHPVERMAFERDLVQQLGRVAARVRSM